MLTELRQKAQVTIPKEIITKLDIFSVSPH